jgi:hypothetical protein
MVFFKMSFIAPKPCYRSCSYIVERRFRFVGLSSILIEARYFSILKVVGAIIEGFLARVLEVGPIAR